MIILYELNLRTTCLCSLSFSWSERNVSSSFLIFFTRSCGLSASSALVDDECCCCCCWPELEDAGAPDVVASEPCCADADVCETRVGGGPTGAGNVFATVVAAASPIPPPDGSLLNTCDEFGTLGVVGEVALGEPSFSPSASNLIASLATDSLTVRALLSLSL